jgi:hypothetical protein
MTEESAPAESEPATAPRRRGEGRGSKFFVLDRAIWEKLWKAETRNRLNLVTAFLVLLAGTGSDHRLTKWSAKACEDYAGMGKPRAKIAIDELIAAGLAEHTENSSRSFPQYRLAEPKASDEPIFLPIQLVTGFGNEIPILRRIRETGDAMALRMLVDLYGLVETDVTHGIPIGNLRKYNETEEARRKVTEMGANTIWALGSVTHSQGEGRWRDIHTVKGKQEEQPFWGRVKLLQQIGALWFEPWIFSGDELDAEPLFPIFHEAFDSQAGPEVRALANAISDAAEALIGERGYLLDQHFDKALVPLPTHHQPPAARWVAKMRVEPDTPGRRLSYGKRVQLLETRKRAYEELAANAQAGRYDKPVGS